MSNLFNNINNDGAGYVVTPQEVIKKDSALLEGLSKAPQDDPLIRKQERSLAGEMAQAYHDMTNSGSDSMSQDDIVQALANSFSNNNSSRSSNNSSPFDQLLSSMGGGDDSQSSGSNYGSGNAGLASMFDGFGPQRNNNSGGNYHSDQSGLNGVFDNMLHGQGLSQAAAGLNNYDSAFGSASPFNSSDANSATASINRAIKNIQSQHVRQAIQNFQNQSYNGGTVADQRSMNSGMARPTLAPGQTSGNDRDHAPVTSDSTIKANSDSTLQGKVNGKSIDGDSVLKTSHADLIDVSKNDLPNGFKLSNTVGDWTGKGNQYTQSINGQVGGADGKQHKVEVWNDGDGMIKSQVDGKVVDENHPDPNGIITYQGNGAGPGQCGIVSINGTNDKTGAKIRVDVTEDITHFDGPGKDGRSGGWAHHGLNAQITDMQGAHGAPLQIGGAIGNAIANQTS